MTDDEIKQRAAGIVEAVWADLYVEKLHMQTTVDQLIAERALREGMAMSAARIAELEDRDRRLMTKQGTFKGVGDPALDAALGTPDAEFTAMVQSLPDNYWARYDLSAVRFGWHQRGLIDKARIAELEDVALDLQTQINESQQ